MKEKIITLINDNQFRDAKELLSTLPVSDIAEILEDVEIEDIARIFRLVKKDDAAEVFSYLPLSVATELLSYLTDKEQVAIINEMFSDDAKEVLEEMPASLVTRILKKCDPDTRKDINTLLSYPEDSAGSVMSVEYADLKIDQTVKQSLSRIRREVDDFETINVCYVIDHQRRLCGYLTLKDLVLADQDDIIGEIARLDTICVRTTQDQEEVAKIFKKYDLTVMPVVDLEDRLVGIITIDDVMDIVEEETTEDIEKMAAITPSDKPYLDVSVWETWKQRIPWLLLLMISATFTGQIISNFEDSLAVLPILTAYIPMLMDSGGNAGSQASVTIIRSISLGDVEFRDLAKVIWKELRVAIIVGATLAVANFGKLILVDRMLFNNTQVTNQVALVVCLTLFVVVIVAKFIGCTLPLVTKKLGFDPAVMASPFITTMVDALGLLVYFQVAVHLISGLV